MNTTLKTFCDHAEAHGHDNANEMLNSILGSSDQAEALRAVMEALNSAFNLQGDPIKTQIAAGFAVGIVNALQVGVRNIPKSCTAEQGADHATA
jgi:hypothetical protein